MKSTQSQRLCGKKTDLKILLQFFWFWRKLLPTVGLLLWGTPSLAAVSSVQSGAWSDPAVWGGTLPKHSDAVVISQGTDVFYDVSSPDVFAGITILGTLRFSNGQDTLLRVNENIIVENGGVFTMGTKTSPIFPGFTAELVFVLGSGKTFIGEDTDGNALNMANDTGLWVKSGGTWEVHGIPFLRTWSKLDQTANAGETEAIVQNDVSDWLMDGVVVFSPTSIPTKNLIEYETRKIKGLEKMSGGKTKITVDQPLSYNHLGTDPFRGEVGLLSRNVRIYTERAGVTDAEIANDVRVRKFAHTIYEAGAQGNIRYAEFHRMGHYGILGRYSMHLHQMLETSKGMVFQGNSCWENGFRCLNIYVSHGVLVEDNVSFNTCSTPINHQRSPLGFNLDNAFVHNLIVGAKSIHVDDRGVVAGDWSRMGGFQGGLKTVNEAYLGNVVTGNRGGFNGGGSGGFMFPEAGNGPAPGSSGQIPFTFVANEVHNDAFHGIFSWQNAVPSRDMLAPFLWGNAGFGIRWGAYGSPFKYHNARVLDNEKAAFNITSVSSFLQDSQLRGRIVNGSPNETAFHVNGYVATQRPDPSVWVVRNSFENFNLGVTQNHTPHDPNSSIDFVGPLPTSELKNRPVLKGASGGVYFQLMNNVFTNVALTHDFDWVANPNSYWKIFDWNGGLGLPKDFVIMRRDQLTQNEQGIITTNLVNSHTLPDNNFVGVITPMTALPSSIDFVNIPNERTMADQKKTTPADFTFHSTADYPPVVAISVDINNKVAKVKVDATDDKGIDRVEILLDWTVVATLTGAPFETTIDLTNHPRRYAYFYARAFDGATEIRDYEQRGYSGVVEVGPEVIFAGQSFQLNNSGNPNDPNNPSNPNDPLIDPNNLSGPPTEEKEAFSFPNPAVTPENPVIRSLLGKAHNIKITIFDSAGKVVHSTQMNGTPSGQVNGVDYFDFVWSGPKASGTYFANVEGDGPETKVRAETKVVVVK